MKTRLCIIILVVSICLNTHRLKNKLRLKNRRIVADVLSQLDYHRLGGYIFTKWAEFGGINLVEQVSGFDGSNGIVFISPLENILYTDSRYTKQAEKQLDMQKWKIVDHPSTLYKRIADNYQNQSIGFDGNHLSYRHFIRLKHQLEPADIQLVNLNNIIKVKKQVDKSDQKVFILSEKYSGQSSDDKLDVIAQKVKQIDNNVKYQLVTDVEEICWTLNLRALNAPILPVFDSLLLIEFKNGQYHKAYLFVDTKMIDDTVTDYLQKMNVEINEQNEYRNVLKNIDNESKFMVDQKSMKFNVFEQIEKFKLVNNISPIAYLKAVKNDIEIEGFIDCHKRDGAALAIAFSQLESDLKDGKEISEYEFAQTVDQIRSQQPLFQSVSFETISASAEHSAMPHYMPKKKNSKLIKQDEIFLLDSGGQYLDCTTDVTRTFLFAKQHQNLERMRNVYTRVLLGNLDLERKVFRNGTEGKVLDKLARSRLQEIGLDYGHGTGHGVGHFLNVHEGPQAIDKHNAQPLMKGMVLSDEPGCYHDFGVRIENMLYIEKDKHNSDHNMLRFKQLTLVPYDSNLMDFEIMTQKDIDFINKYHQIVYQKVSVLLEDYPNALEWLKVRTRPI